MKAKIAVLAGDGVGREIVPEAVKILKAVGDAYHHSFEFAAGDIGGQAIDKVGVPLPQETLALAKQSDAVLLGADKPEVAAGQIYNVADQRVFTVRQRIELMASTLGHAW